VKPLPPAIANVRAALEVHHRSGVATVRIKGHVVRVPTSRQTFILHLSFSVRRPITLGLMAFHNGRPVGSVPLIGFKPRRGQLVLNLTRADWPTRLAFLTDTPKVSLVSPGSSLSGTVALRATASAIKGRSIASVRFDESAAGKNAWTAIATLTAAPFTTPFDTTKVAPGAYDFRAVVVDSAGSTAVSAVRTARVVPGGTAG
jgi:hypothetical protein